MAEEAPDLAGWIGRSVEAHDRAEAGPLVRLAATLGHDGAHWPAGVLPPLAHWLYHLPGVPRAALGTDGHPIRGGLLPPMPGLRRMWAGGRLVFRAPVEIGAALTKCSRIAAVERKGAMIFVTVTHSIEADGRLAIEEEQDLVYLPITAPGPPKRLDTPTPETVLHHHADEVLLFRFSALTFNAHRIHYDLAYAREVELYPGLVVHGPLQAMLLIDHGLRDGAAPQRFTFRARAPLYVGRDFTSVRAADRMWVRDANGTITMTAEL